MKYDEDVHQAMFIDVNVSNLCMFRLYNFDRWNTELV